MSITVLEPGMLTTIQAAPRTGFRHMAIPASGAADPLSLALANRLVGKPLQAAALEATISGPTLRFEHAHLFAITGATAPAELNGKIVDRHTTLAASKGDVLTLGQAHSGARTYIAFAGELQAERFFGSVSTYLPANLAGFNGRALEAGDVLEIKARGDRPLRLNTPEKFRPPMSDSVALRCCVTAETQLLNEDSHRALFEQNFEVSERTSRMGLQLEGPRLTIESDGRMPSAPVFPGTIQCPQNGKPFLLSIDAATTGGYPRIGQIARLDRHIIGQLRPGTRVRFVQREPDLAIHELRQKQEYWREWLAGIGSLI